MEEAGEKEWIGVPENPFTTGRGDPDYASLASRHQSLQPFLSSGKVRWQDSAALVEVTRVLFKEYFDVRDWTVAPGHLCPALPNRSNYVYYIRDLLHHSVANSSPSGGRREELTATSEEGQRTSGATRIRGIDIGTGSSCVYPLLAASAFGWDMLATDINDEAISNARDNVSRNSHLAGKVTVFDSRSCASEETKEASAEGSRDVEWPILQRVVGEGERFDFSMCNPPFFERMEEAGLNPRTAHGGSRDEMVTPGGEVAFLKRMIEESVILRDRIRWYTTMAGKKSTMKALLPLLREKGIPEIRTTTLEQGRTWRWVIAWSFVKNVAKPQRKRKWLNDSRAECL